MPVDLKMPTANIVQYIYKAMDGNIEEVADILGCDVETIEKIEAGKEQYTKQQISKILEFYKVDRLEPPTRFSDGEVEKILRLWRTRISKGNFKDAKKYHEKFHLEKYDVLPAGLDLSMLYNMFLVKYFINTNSIDDAMITLRAAEPKVEEANPENQYHYHYNKGVILIFLEDYKEALKHFSIAYKLDYVEVKPHAHMIHYNMGVCYSKLGMCIRAIAQYEIAYTLLDREQPYYFAMVISNNLGVEYIRAKDLELAKKYINDAMRLSVKLADEKNYQLALQNAGCINIKENDFEKALEYFEKSFDYAEEGESSFFDTLFYKMLCLISSKHPSAELELSVAKLTSKDNDYFLTLFVALSHLRDLENEEAEDFIENTTIPWLMERKEYYRIQYIYQFMINHYTELDYKNDVLRIQDKSNGLYEIMLLGGEELEKEKIDLLFIDFNTGKPSD